MIFANNHWRLLASAASAALVTIGVTPIVRRMALRWSQVDRPTGERWARRVVARLGGVAIGIGVASAATLWIAWDRLLVGLGVGCVLVFGIGVWDDLRRLRPYTKLLWQLAVGALLVTWGLRFSFVDWPWISIPVSIFWFVLVMNAFNLLDNMDGLAVGVGAIAAAFCGFHAALNGQWMVASFAAIVGGSCLGFLWYNFPPAKIYMGDSGSHLLGLSLSVLALLGTQQHSAQLLSIVIVPVMVLAVPIFDTCFVTIQRLLHDTHPFQGGTDHVSHRLAILGLSQRHTVLILYGASATFGLLSVLSTQARSLSAMVVWWLVLAGVLLLGAYLAKVKVYEVKREPLAMPAPTGDQPTTLIETMLLHKRRLVEVLIDFSLICSAYAAAHLLRYEGNLTHDLQRLIIESLPMILVIKLLCLAGSGLYRGVWRYVSLADVLTIVKGVTLGSIFSSLAVLYAWRFRGYSRAVFVIDWLLLVVAVSASRLAERLLDEWIVSASEGSTPVLIIGAGDTGELLLRQVKQRGQPRRRVVGFLDDDPSKLGSRIHGRAVLGGRKALSSVLQIYGIREVFVAMGQPPRDLLRQVQEACENQGVRWRIITTLAQEGEQ